LLHHHNNFFSRYISFLHNFFPSFLSFYYFFSWLFLNSLSIRFITGFTAVATCSPRLPNFEYILHFEWKLIDMRSISFTVMVFECLMTELNKIDISVKGDGCMWIKVRWIYCTIINKPPIINDTKLLPRCSSIYQLAWVMHT